MTQKTLPTTFKTELQKLILKLCHSLNLPMHFNHKGPKLFTEHQRLSLIILFRRSRKSLRDFIRELPELKWINWLDLKRLPSKSTLHSWDLQIPANQLKIFNSIILREEMPSMMAIDATGIDSWQRSRHYGKRIDEVHRNHMPYAKLDIFIDVETKLIHDHILKIKPRHDSISAASIFRRSKLKNVKILADKGYDSEKLHQIVASKGNILFAPVRKSTRKIPKGYHRKRCAQGDKDYSKRNTVESVIHSFKSVRIHALKCKKSYMKKREMAWNILVYNLEKLSRIESLFQWLIKPSFWTRPTIRKLYKQSIILQNLQWH